MAFFLASASGVLSKYQPLPVSALRVKRPLSASQKLCAFYPKKRSSPLHFLNDSQPGTTAVNRSGTCTLCRHWLASLKCKSASFIDRLSCTIGTPKRFDNFCSCLARGTQSSNHLNGRFRQLLLQHSACSLPVAVRLFRTQDGRLPNPWDCNLLRRDARNKVYWTYFIFNKKRLKYDHFTTASHSLRTISVGDIFITLIQKSFPLVFSFWWQSLKWILPTYMNTSSLVFLQHDFRIYFLNILYSPITGSHAYAGMHHQTYTLEVFVMNRVLGLTSAFSWFLLFAMAEELVISMNMVDSSGIGKSVGSWLLQSHPMA